jgi:6-phosphogluconate dehydrogenase
MGISEMNDVRCDFGMVGLGVMGRNLALNALDRGFAVAGYDIDPEKVRALDREARPYPVRATGDLKEFTEALRVPRVVMMMVPAGPPADSALRGLLEHLQPGDIIIDGGNSHFTDTELRQKSLGEKGIHFMGFGISGGEEGARHGPSIMAGGPRAGWERVRPIFEAMAARAGNNEPCAAWLGPDGAGHFVKMVHNGIEYGLMELLAESYDLMRRGLRMTDDQIQRAFAQWDAGESAGFLVEITAEIFKRVDALTGRRLIDVIRDVARQKGTGIWTSQDAMEQHVPVPTIDIAVAMRDLSVLESQRETASHLLRGPLDHFDGNRQAFLVRLCGGYLAASLLVYSQGFALIRAASEAYHYGIDLATVARIWRGGCIIRSALLEKIVAAFQRDSRLPLLFLDAPLQQLLQHHQSDMRQVCCMAADLGIPAPAFMTALAYYDAWRSPALPDNLIQAQRDYFGAHSYERIDQRGDFHTEWRAA